MEEHIVESIVAAMKGKVFAEKVFAEKVFADLVEFCLRVDGGFVTRSVLSNLITAGLLQISRT